MMVTRDPPDAADDDDDDADADVGIDDNMLLGSTDGVPLLLDCDGNAMGTVMEVAIGDAVIVVGIAVGTEVGLYVGAGDGAFVGFCTTGACTDMVNPVLVAKLEEMALVVAEVDNNDTMVDPETEGGTMTVYLTDRPTIVAAC